MIDDELPVNDPDELAVEEEFKNKNVAEQSANTVPPPAVKTPAVSSEATTETKPQTATPSPAQPRPVKPKPTTPPSSPIQAKPQTLSSSSSPDIDRLRNLAKSSGLSTSMDSIGEDNGGMLFDIEVLEEGDDGRPMVHTERGVSASNERELRELYALSDQKIRIIRRYGEQAQATAQAPQPMTVQQQASSTPRAATISYPAVEKSVEPPKYFNVSGVECKLENGKVYQRQWVRLAGADAESFRLVNDANNKIVPIDGKHIEQKKWVLIQENSDEGE